MRIIKNEVPIKVKTKSISFHIKYSDNQIQQYPLKTKKAQNKTYKWYKTQNKDNNEKVQTKVERPNPNP